jgi:hypothetical protein
MSLDKFNNFLKINIYLNKALGASKEDKSAASRIILILKGMKTGLYLK